MQVTQLETSWVSCPLFAPKAGRRQLPENQILDNICRQQEQNPGNTWVIVYLLKHLASS